MLLASLNLQKLAQVEPYLESGARLLVTDQRGLVLVNTTPILGMAPGESIGERLFRFATVIKGRHRRPGHARRAGLPVDAGRHQRRGRRGPGGLGLGAPRDGLAAAANRRFRQDLALAAAVAAKPVPGPVVPDRAGAAAPHPAHRGPGGSGWPTATWARASRARCRVASWAT
ncbi:MAG: hypothetical protein U1F53_10585 [Burkholderiaceae bacterium]